MARGGKWLRVAADGGKWHESLRVACSHLQPPAQAATCSHLPKQPLAATCPSSHLQPLAATCPSSRKWLQVAASGCMSKWLQVAASDCVFEKQNDARLLPLCIFGFPPADDLESMIVNDDYYISHIVIFITSFERR